MMHTRKATLLIDIPRKHLHHNNFKYQLQKHFSSRRAKEYHENES
uniref:Uncharacterized protein n=1 Tax=Rhizophora mucronata TaxID=61149 RepID=A0A2P2QWM7_RHIMU